MTLDLLVRLSILEFESRLVDITTFSENWKSITLSYTVSSAFATVAFSAC